jgi:type I restriction enzyme S subunit
MNWPVVLLENVCKVVTKGTTPRTLGKEYSCQGIPFIRAENLQGDEIVLDEKTLFIDEETNSTLSRSKIYSDDVLISIAGTIGRVAIVPKSLPQLNCNQAVAIIRLQKQFLESRFLLHWLKSTGAQAQMTGSRVTLTISNLSLGQIKKLMVPLPPISEQRRIVELLDQADALRKKRAEADTKSDRILPALFIKMFGDPATNPMGWDVQTLDDIDTKFRYGTSARCTAEPEGLPVLRIPNILKEEIDISDLKYGNFSAKELKNLSLDKGDLLFVRTNGNPDYVGRCAVFELQEPYLFASYLIRARLDSNRADPWFVAACLRTPQGRQVMGPYIRTTAGQSNISVEGLKQIPIPLPPVEHQRHFKNRLKDFYKLRLTCQNAMNSLENLFQVMLHQAFSGNLTADWRKAHMQELLQEMEHQAKALGIPHAIEYEQMKLI